MMEVMGEATSKPFALLLGHKTYEIFAAHWPHAPEEEGAKVFNEATKYVASTTLTSVEWSNSILIEGDVADGLGGPVHRHDAHAHAAEGGVELAGCGVARGRS